MFLGKREISLDVQLKIPLKKKLEALAGAERRSVENQTVCLIDNGLAVFEGEHKSSKKNWS
jgi:hypothetical protein